MTKPRRKRQKSNSNGPILVVFAILLLAFAVYSRRSLTIQKPVIEKESPPSATADSANRIEIVSTLPADSEKLHQSQTSAQFAQNTLLSAGFSKIPMTRAKETVRFQIVFDIEKNNCNFGDFDLIKGITSDAEDKSFLLSVEPLKERSAIRFSIPVSLSDLLQNKSFPITLPSSERSRDFGVYVCLDKKQTKSCQDKSPLLGSEWSEYLNNPNSPDKIIYFQMISIKGADAYLIPSQSWEKTSLDSLEQKGQSIFEEAGGSLRKMADMLSALGSLSARVTGKSLNLPLYYRDPGCNSAPR